MQAWSEDGVRQERTGWRDQRISERHRVWGFNCPCVDLDFLVAEYNIGKPVALVEYKHFEAMRPNFDHPTYWALTHLANGYSEGGEAMPLPFLVAFYWPDIWAFRVCPINAAAKDNFTWWELCTEYEFVRRLYVFRRRTLTRELENRLHKVLPEAEAAA